MELLDDVVIITDEDEDDDDDDDDASLFDRFVEDDVSSAEGDA